MAENNNGGWSVNNDRVIIDGDQQNSEPVNRDNLVLHRINENGTIGEMVDTINENFKNIAMHGGGPAGMDGINGFDGVDGTNVEYIYALSDEMIPGEHYPTDSATLRSMFDTTDFYGVYKYNNKIEWYDHAQPISKEHKNEYVFSRFRRTNDENSPWYYAEEPVLWAHWGETGRDGDGVEYIFRIYDHELTDDERLNAFSYMDSMDNEMKVIYNIDDFYPGTTWFNAANKSKAESALKKAGLYSNASNFDTRWAAKFNFCDNGSWTDDPMGTGYGKPYEYVAIRRSNADEETDKKEWSKYSEPALWSKYSFEGRIFIIYANLPNDQKPTVENGLAPKKGDGWWDVESDKLIFSPSNGSGRIPSIWTDNNLDTPDNYFAWMCSGIFDHTGKNVSWSNPICISGKDGQPGEDGTNIQFIYTLSVDMPDYPNPITNKSEANNLFDSVENATRNAEGYKSSVYGGTEWFDNALPISPEEPTEYVWTRTKDGEDDNGNPIWTYLTHPVIWAHWGEDGTDGDGVEYIFHLSDSETFDDAAEPVKLEFMNKYQKIVYNLNDFYPSDDWFDKVVDGELVNKKKAIEAATKAAQFDSSIDVLYFESQWSNIKRDLDKGWTDNPQGTSPMMPYEFVSIRRCDPDASVRTWSDFSEPALWSYYGKATRMFVVYCNMEPNVTPATPSDGYWNVGGSPELTMSRSDESPYKCNALNNGYPDGSSNPSDWTSHKGYWEDDNDDFDDMISWSSSAIFAEDGTIVVPWSKPHRLTGAPGKPGEDGADIEFIYAVEPTMERGRNYPNVIRKASEDDPTYTWEDLFNDVESAEGTPKCVPFSGSGGTVTTWYDNAQAIDKAHKTVFAWSRHRDHGLDKPWEYDPEPFVWSHWGEDGKDGDGVEYIFLTADHNTIQDDELPVKGSELTPGTVKKVIYNMDDFYPGPGWFTDGTNNTKNHKEDARVALQLEDLYDSTTFESDWENHFGFTFPEGDNGSYWTDNPSGVSPDARFEFVSIRKSDYDSNGNKVWGDFSNPVIWSSYGKSTRTFIVYCNTVKDIAPVSGTPSKPTGGWWNSTGNALVLSEDNPVAYEKDILSESEREAIHNHAVYGTYESNIGFWHDDDIDVPNTIVWISTGTFDESGDNLSWSEPHRITGPDGQRGTDGSDIQFIYALTDNPHYPPKNSSTYTRNDLFDDVENPTSDHAINAQAAGYITIGTDPDDNTVKYIEYPATDGTKWYDRARIISRVNKIEYCASRKLPAGMDVWIPDNAPFVWAHWGEDGTDGDGIEYIFMTCEQPFSVSLSTWQSKVSLEALSTYHYGIYSIDDLIPNTVWFSDENKAFYKPTVQKYVVAEGETFDESDYNTAWNDMKGFFGFDSQTHGLGVWYDNPQDLTPEYPYQYVSVRKSPDGVWGEFSYPTLWSKYNITQFKSMVFTKAKVGIDLSSIHPDGGKFITPTPDPTTYGGISYTWYDSPQATANDEVIWMTTATFREDQPNAPYKLWSSPQKMSDRTDFQVEWSESDLTVNEVTILNNMLNSSEYNFGTFLQGHTESEAEANWRAKVKTDTIANPNISVGVDFDDDPGQAVLMATCQLTNGTWSNWKVVRVKGEQGEPGTSITVKDRIDHEVYLADGTTYNWENVQTAITNPTLKRTPVEGDFLIVYPHDVTEDGIYWGDTSDSRGGALYMFKYVNGSWTDYSNYDGNTPNGETNGNSYGSPNKHLILWDGDSWQDLGELTGPEGPEGKSWAVYTRYANDDFSQTAKACHKKFVSNENIPTAKWVGFLTYEIISGIDPDEAYDEDDYIWSLFKGQDGYGYEYIFWANNENVAPPVPITTDAEDAIDDFEPNVDGYQWVDNPIEPTLSNRYVWMCWRKHDGANNNWGKFRGANGDLSTETGAKARLWQVYANSIVSVDEYFHADEDISPSDPLFTNTYTTVSSLPSGWTSFWHPKSDVIGTGANSNYKWDDNRRYLFNREVVTYTDGTMNILDSHFISAWASGIIDIQDYYCLESADSNNWDPGETAPNLTNLDYPKIPGLTYISGSGNYGEEGKDYWTRDVSKTKMNADWPVLWNVSYKIYDDSVDGHFTFDDGRTSFTTPFVIGVYGEGTQGADAIYADLDNEMDSISVDQTNKTLYAETLVTNVKMYKGGVGDTTMKIHDIDISGEEALKSSYTLDYYSSDDDNATSLCHRVFTYNSSTQQYTVSGDSDIFGNPSDSNYDNIIRVKITFNIARNTEINHSSKVVISVTNKVNENISTTRKVSYTLVTTTDKAVYSIVLDETKILETDDGNGNKSVSPNDFHAYVIERAGDDTSRNTRDINGKFKLYLYVNDDLNNVITFNTNYEVYFYHRTESTSGLPQGITTVPVEAGTKLTFQLNGYTKTGSQILIDRETVYVIKEGTDGAPGAAGNGYEYRYARYKENGGSAYPSPVCNISASQQASSVSNPKVHFGNSTTAISTYPEMSGVDATYTYEYRIERTIASTAGSWSTPKLIGKYLTTSGISSEVESIINSIVSDQSSVLGGAISRVSTLSSYFDSNGVLKEGSFPSGILSGYIDENLNAKVAGVIASEASLSTFADWVDYEHGRITSVGASYEALSGTLTNYALQSELDDVTSAIDTFKVDAHDKFASMDRTVANTSYITNPEGVLMVNVPDYVTWFNTEGDMSTNKSGVEADERRNVEWVLCNNGSNYFTTAPYKVNGSSTGLSTLYDENSKDKTIALQLFVPKSSVSETGINSIKNTLKNVTVAVSLSGDGSPVSYSITSNPTSLTTLSVVTNTNPGSSQVKLIAYADVNLGYDSNQSDPHSYTFTSLSWEVGAVSVGTSVSDVSFAYTKMASVDDKPWFATIDPQGANNKEDVFYNLSLNQSYGYTLKNEDGDIMAAKTYGTLDITSQEGYAFKLLPAAGISVSDVVNYLTGTGTTTITQASWISSDKNIPYNTISKEYYVACSYSSGNRPNGPVSYAVELSDSGISNSSNTVNFISTGISDLIDNSISVSMSRIANASTYTSDRGGICSSIAVNGSTVTLSLSTIGSSGRQRDIVNVFSIATDYINSQVNLTFSNETNSENVNYLILPSLYTSTTITNVNYAFNGYISSFPQASAYDYTKSFYETTKDDHASYYFLNNPTFGTTSIYEWKNISNNRTITVNFNNAYKSGNMYYLTVVVRRYLSRTAGTSGQITVSMTATNANNMVWDTLYQTRVINCPFKSYILDKISVTIKDRSVSDTFEDSRKNATGNPTSYLSVIEDERPYLIPVVTELATISQTVSNGIASTEIIVGVGDNYAAQVFQATEDGSAIWMEADKVGIKSSHFNLDENGVTMKGNLYATDLMGRITAGIIGNDNTDSNDVKFFAGTTSYTENTLFNDINNAPFRVYENGHIVANDIEISAENGNTKLDNEGLHSTELKNTTINVNETHYADESYEFSNGNYTGDVSIDTVLNSYGLSIVANGTLTNGTDTMDVSGNRLYIKYFDRIVNPDWDTAGKPMYKKDYLYGVPVLCMWYMGQEYIMSPGSWMTNTASDSSNIRWVSDKSVYKYGFNDTYANITYCCTSKTSGRPTLYSLISTAGNYYIFNDTNAGKFVTGRSTESLYKIRVESLGSDETTNKSLISQYGLATDTTSKDTINSTPAKVLVNNIPEAYRGIGNYNTNISPDICQTYKSFIPASATMADILWYQCFDNSTSVCQNLYSFMTKIVTPSNTGASDYWYETGSSSSSEYKMYGFYGELPYDSGSHVNTKSVSLLVDYYPIFTITNGTTVSTSTNMVYAKCTYTVHGRYNPSASGARFTYTGDSSHNYAVQDFSFTLNFEFVLEFNNNVNNSQIENKIISFLSNFDFTNSSYLLNSHISFEAHLTGLQIIGNAFGTSKQISKKVF